jgi:type IV pilus assembly protein PilY1
MRKVFALVIAVLSVILIGGSVAGSNRTLLDLRTGPLINSGDVSNLALVLSVEFPTTKAAYPHAIDYVATKKYLGYYNSSTCYGYAGTSADGYFVPSGATNASYECNLPGTGTGWSGNFMNYANTSAVDIMRLALTGGDRYVDESSTTATTPRTILQRAILPSDASSSGGSRNTNFYAGGTNGSANWSVVTLAKGAMTAALTPFGSNTNVYVKACDDKIFFGNTNTGQCLSPGNNANLAVNSMVTASTPTSTKVTGIFKARVLVCDSTEGPLRTDLCRQNPDGFYKPVGEIQKNSDKVRVAAFGYLIDSEDWGKSTEGSRYGGVLRAPMKFAGPSQKSSSGIVSLNTEKEWDEKTGAFISKPINTSNETGYATTGVINYVNQFGRLTRNDGVGIDVYKRRDPVGELYYEAIRYFQGKQPTPSAISSTTSTLLAGYPIYTTWTDPMQTSCQRNYALLIGDNNTSKDADLPGSKVASQTRTTDSTTVDSKTVTLDADYWTQRVSSFETNGLLTYTDGQGVVNRPANGNAASGSTGVQSGSPYNALATTTFSDSASYLYAGIAYWANTQQIRPDKPQARVRTFVIDVDEGGDGTLNRSRGLYLAGKYGGFSDVGPDGSSATGEGNPFKTYVNGTLTTSQNEWLAADSSTSPSGYFLASQPERLILAIRKIFAEASKPSGNLAGGAKSEESVKDGVTTYYKSQIDSLDWSGTVVRNEIPIIKIEGSSETTVWDAANILTGIQSGTTTLNPFPLPANRKIFSYSNSTGSGVPFTWANLDAVVKTSLQTNPATGIVETVTDGQARLDYIRGVRTAEFDVARNYRARRRIMGDSINSAPVLKGKPSTDILDASYQTFMSTNLGRTPTVYVGSNDGMLHAFRAAESKTDPDNGKELFAYIPRAVSEKLNKLTDPGYVKEPYVDGALTVNEARTYKAASSSVDWATVLVSGMGGGAKGLFALDVTDPASFGAGNALWEFTNADDADMGNLLAEPKIVKLAMNGNSSATPNYKWFAMVTSGYNNYTNGGSADKQALFLLSLEKAPGMAWTLGSNYFKITANNSAFTSTSTAATGLGMPGVATVNDNALFAYAGDLQGNLWKFDLRGASTTWTGSSVASVLFIARNPANTATQPITVIPAVTLNVVGGYQIGFGTGKFIEPTDSLSTSAAQQSLYSIWDNDDGKKFERVPTGSGTSSVNGLITRTLTATAGTGVITGPAFFYGTSSTAGSGQYRGWVADLSTTMERVAVNPKVDYGVMQINSTIPGGDPCVSTGVANKYKYNPSTGITFLTTESTPSSNTNSYLPSPLLLNAGDAVWSVRTGSGRYLVTRTIISISPSVNGETDISKISVTSIAGRISWREITNFQ